MACSVFGLSMHSVGASRPPPAAATPQSMTPRGRCRRAPARACASHRCLSLIGCPLKRLPALDSIAGAAAAARAIAEALARSCVYEASTA